MSQRWKKAKLATQDSLTALRRIAIQKLARREHSRKELRQALRIKYPDAGSLVEDVLDDLIAAGYLNEQRFTEAYIRYRRERGYGPLRIELELEAKGISPDLMEQHLDMHDAIWREYLSRVRTKRFGSKPPKEMAEKARQIRFLQYRGFDLSQIHSLWRDAN
jgi:regulatory protein